MKKVELTLSKLGLTDGEAKVYIALLSLGQVTVGPIVEKAEVSSSKVYIILERLLRKGLVSYITKNKTKYFQASKPTALLDYVHQKEKELQATKEEVTIVTGDLTKLIAQKKVREGAKIYKGYAGLKTGWLEAIERIPSGGKYYFFSQGFGEDPYLQRFFAQVARELRKRSIQINGLAHENERKVYEKKYKRLGYKMAYVQFPLPADTTVAGDTVLIFVWDKSEPILYCIQSTALVASYLSFFESLWNQAKK